MIHFINEIASCPKLNISINKNDSNSSTIEARSTAAAMSCPMRSPHHSVRLNAMIEECALAACGVLLIDNASRVDKNTLHQVLRVWGMMTPAARPALFLVFSTDGIAEDTAEAIGWAAAKA